MWFKNRISPTSSGSKISLGPTDKKLGGLVSRGGWYFDLIQEELSKKHLDVTMVQPKFEPAVGAVLIGLAELGIKWDKDVVKSMEESLKN